MQDSKLKKKKMNKEHFNFKTKSSIYNFYLYLILPREGKLLCGVWEIRFLKKEKGSMSVCECQWAKDHRILSPSKLYHFKNSVNM